MRAQGIMPRSSRVACSGRSFKRKLPLLIISAMINWYCTRVHKFSPLGLFSCFDSFCISRHEMNLFSDGYIVIWKRTCILIVNLKSFDIVLMCASLFISYSFPSSTFLFYRDIKYILVLGSKQYQTDLTHLSHWPNLSIAVSRFLCRGRGTAMSAN